MSNPGDFIIENGVLKKYVGPGGDVTIPDIVTSIGDWAFNGCSSLTSVTIPESVTSIGSWAFYDCESLTSVTIPESVTSIGDEAFASCKNLISVTIPDSVMSIGKGAFKECKSLTDKQGFIILKGVLFGYYGSGGFVTIPENVISISDHAFYWKRSLTSVTVPGSVTSIGDLAFGDCNSLKQVTILEGVRSIGKKAFYNCSSLTEMTISESVIEINDNAFEGCHSLADRQGFIIVKGTLFDYVGPGGSVTIPDCVTRIGGWAFSGCSSLTSVMIPDSVTSIGNGAFDGCSGLTSLMIPDNVTSIGSLLVSGCKKLDWVSLTRMAFLSTEPDYNFGAVFYKDIPINTVLRIRSEKGETVLCFSNKNGHHNLENYGEPGFWEKYDHYLLYSEVFKFKVQTRLISAVGRLLYPVELSEDCLSQYLLLLKTNIKKLVPLLEEFNCPEGVRMLFEKGMIDESNKKAILKQIAACEDPAFTALKEELINTKVSPSIQLSEKTAVERVFTSILDETKYNEKDCDGRIKEYYSLNTKTLPILKDSDGKTVPASILAWLLTAHEKLRKYSYGRPDVVVAYVKPGLCPEASEIVAMLDTSRLQEVIRSMANEYMGTWTRKDNLAYPICRYADEETMAELCARAPKWRSSVSGDNAPPLLAMRKAALYSDTRAAMLFAERYGELDKYAALRGMTEDELRDKYLSDVGLDEAGGKAYNLGNQTVTARLQKDLSFLFELPNGKTAKSLPKKGADPEKYEAAKADFDEMRKAVKKIVKSRSDVLFSDFLSGRERSATDWQEAYLKNPLLRAVAELIVWEQGGKTFTLSESGPIDSAGKVYVFTDAPIKLAHPMEMQTGELTAWQRYFNSRGLKQPFLQVWEPVIDPATIKPDRYAGSVQPIYRFSGKDKHGIHSGNLHAFSEDIGFSLDGCDLDYKASTWRVNWNADDENYTLGKFSFDTYTRQVNHIVSLLDKWTVEDRVKKDDVSVMDLMDGFTLAQIMEFIAVAQEAQAVNVLALLLEYKNAHFADFDPMDEFTLEW